jgi:hypothetical protein
LWWWDWLVSVELIGCRFGGFAALAAQEVNYDSGSKRTRNAMKATAIVSGIQSVTWFVSLGVVITQAVQRRKAARRQVHADQLAGQTKGEVAV